MDAPQILSSLRSAGFSLQVVEDRILVRPKCRITDRHRQLIRGHRPQLFALLAGEPPPLTDQDREDLAEAREDADREAARIRAWSVLVAMPDGDDRPHRWITMICTGGHDQARRNAEGTFTSGRVIDIREGAT